MKHTNSKFKAKTETTSQSHNQQIQQASVSFKKTDDAGISFLLAEFNFLAEFAHNSIHHAERRVDVFLTLASAVLGGLALLLSQSDKIDLRVSLVIASCSLFVLVLVGCITFTQVLHLTISVSEH